MKTSTELKLPAIEVRQGPQHLLYTFAIDGKLIPSFSTISRIHRDGNKEIEGYQRPEVLSHIAEIRNYLDSDAPMIPNAIVIAFDSRVRFESNESTKGTTPYLRTGVLVIPVDEEIEPEDKSGFIVDGQQRIAAIRDAEVESFPICVTAFITNDVREQTEQFILVNSTKPLPKGLIYELLPGTSAVLPTMLERRRFPAHLLNLLNNEDASPLKGRIQTPTTPGGSIKDNSILKMLENSLSDGVLYRFRYVDDGPGDVDSMMALLINFWGAVGKIFPHAWSLPPSPKVNLSRTYNRSRISAGGLMDIGISAQVGNGSGTKFRTQLRIFNCSLITFLFNTRA